MLVTIACPHTTDAVPILAETDASAPVEAE